MIRKLTDTGTIRPASSARRYVVKMYDYKNPNEFWYWQGVIHAAGIGFASWVCDLDDATKYRTKREAMRVCDAHKQRRPKAADRYTVEAA